MEGATERKASQIEDVCRGIDKEMAAIHAVVDRLENDLMPVRLCVKNPIQDRPAATTSVPERSPVNNRLEELRTVISCERKRLETLLDEIQI